MIFKREQLSVIYDTLFDWLSAKTPGSHSTMSRLKYYHKRIWEPIAFMQKQISQQEELTDEEYDFITCSSYNGTIFRIHNYNPKYKAHICENCNYQSWSSTIDGVSNVTNMDGKVLLIIGTAFNGISVFGLLYFMFKYKYIDFTKIDNFKNPKKLLRYENEHEIAYPMLLESINDVKLIEKVKLSEWQTNSINIPRNQWIRHTL